MKNDANETGLAPIHKKRSFLYTFFHIDQKHNLMESQRANSILKKILDFFSDHNSDNRRF